MRLLFIAFAAALAAVIACSKNAPDESRIESFRGELYVDKGLDSVGGETTDTIEFILDDPYYTLFFITRNARMCDSEGKVTDFGKPSVKLSPTHIFSGGCDSIRIPHGIFDAVFYGDTAAVLTRTDYERSIKYEMRLSKHGR